MGDMVPFGVDRVVCSRSACGGVDHAEAASDGRSDCALVGFAGEDVGSVLRELDKAAMRPDMLVCDYRLPHNQTALDVMRQMREHCGELPVLVVTGDTAAETLQAIQKSGASLLHKPIAPTRLRTAMFFAMQGSATAQ